VKALHEGDDPLCKRVSEAHVAGDLVVRRHVVGPRSGDGGRPIKRGENGRLDRRARSVALRAAVRNGWDGAAGRRHCWDRRSLRVVTDRRPAATMRSVMVRSGCASKRFG
jgi:hypothetical protein